MNRKEFWDKVRSLYPNIAWIKHLLAFLRIRRVNRWRLSEDLVLSCEVDDQKKEDVVGTYLKKYGKHFKSLERKFNKTLKASPTLKNRNDIDHLRIEMYFCHLAYGFQADEFICYHLVDLPAERRREYVSDSDRYRYVFSYNDIKDIQIFNNKFKTYKYFAPYYARDALGVNQKTSFEEFSQFVEKHPVFVKKNVFESMGRSVELVNVSTSSFSPRELFNSLRKQGTLLLEELVEQSPKMAALNRSSVNTVRCITVNTRHGIEIPYSFMKIGRAGSFVDNGGAGGILVGIDGRTGKLNSDGFDENDIRYTQHPDSGVVFKAYALPDWDKLIELCYEISSKIPSVKYIGWDFAHTNNNKWVVIEGNGMSQLIGPQIVWEKGIKAEFSRILEDVDPII